MDSEYPLAEYPDGIDLSALPIEDRAILLGGLEKYLLENVFGGVPLFSQGSLVVYSDRVNLPWDVYNFSFGFGDRFSELTADDSTVKMTGGSYGLSGEFTWREGYEEDPEGWNPWTNERSSSRDFTDLICDALYELVPDATQTGSTVVPEIASADPVPLDPVTEEDGTVRSVTWKIPIRNGLEWTFASETVLSGLP